MVYVDMSTASSAELVFSVICHVHMIERYMYLRLGVHDACVDVVGELQGVYCIVVFDRVEASLPCIDGTSKYAWMHVWMYCCLVL